MREHRHLGAYGLITNGTKILLIKKSRGAYTGKLDLPGGSFEHGETPKECVSREIIEETGLKVKQVKLYDAISCNVQWLDGNEMEDLHHIGIIYKVEVEDDKNIKEDADGLDSLGAVWHEIKDLNKEDVSPFVFQMISSFN